VSTARIRSTVLDSAARLRAIVMAANEGMLLGSEESLIATLGVSRTTVRQVARLLEREGLLKVRRGINGGYFAARPDVHTIEAAVSAYLDIVHTDPEDLTVVASVLWVEVLRRAARIRDGRASVLAERYSAEVRAVRSDAPFHEVLQVEQQSRKAIFDLIQSRYIELIFQINTAFAQGRMAPTAVLDGTDTHREFIRAWRNAKLLEFESIADGDPELAAMAARHGRNIWHRRIWQHDAP
jgi:GntR family transcriptional regulator, transcriptional repressor for pyruvate dehydrogenase complex